MLLLLKKKWRFSEERVLFELCGPKLFKKSKIFELGIDLESKAFKKWAFPE